MNIILTKSPMFLVKWVADVLGFLMNAIFNFLDLIGIPNIGLAIILFTVIMYLCMTPLQVKQQKFSKLNAIMSPEIQKIQKKYKGKKDQTSMMKQQEEIQAVYQKYGVSPTGSCLQLLIQMPILFALYQVIYHIPGYIDSIGSKLMSLVTQKGFSEFFIKFIEKKEYANLLTGENPSKEAIVDALYKLNPSQWSALSEASKGMYDVEPVHQVINKYTSFLGLNLADTPLNIIMEGLKVGAILLVIGALLIPILAWFSQWISMKLMPQPDNSNGEGGTMENTMKSMNTFMPVMSAVFCFTFAVGIGVYWIAGAVVRSIQQLVINKYIDKTDINEIIKANMEKVNKKRAKQGLPPQKITNQAKINVKNLEVDQEQEEKKEQNNKEKIKKSTEYYKDTAQAKPGSLASKANMVKMFEEKNRK